MPPRYNTLVISDLHLGEDLNPHATEATRKHIDHVEENLVQFLRHYAQRRENGRPWRLVINGDFLDFMSVFIRPEDGEEATHDERRFGLSRRPEVAGRQLALVAERHSEVFRALARFAGRGNRIEIIAGNHDTELQFPPVQRALRQVIVRAWSELADSRRAGALSAEAIGEAVNFNRWFFYEPGVAWIEHGHQYDECCSFEYQLYPRAPGGSDIMLNVDTAGSRYITNYVAEADPHQQEEWTALGYLRFGLGLGLRQCARLVWGYTLFAIKLLGAWRRYSQAIRDRRRAAEVHRRRLCKLAAERGLEHRTLMSIDNLRRRPVVRHLRRVSAVVMADKVFSYGIAVLVSLAAVLLLPLPWKAAAPALVLGSAFLVTRWTGRNRIIDPAMGLELVTERILRQVDAQAIVFGHTHSPVARELPGGGRYFNSGTWVPTAKPGILNAFSHLIIRPTDKGADIGIYQWIAGASRAMVLEGSSPEPEPAPLTRPERAPVRAAKAIQISS
jgi:UDP-2,3-diacylglucosamine pyrophosphatase LpxH